MARAPALQAGGRGFEPLILHRREGARPLRGSGRPERGGSLTGWKEEKDKEKATRGRKAARAPEKEVERSSKDTAPYRAERARGRARRAQVNKGAWGMPWLPEAKKDAEGRERLRGGANGR